MEIKKHIPNVITLLNLLSGCIAITYAAVEQFDLAFIWVAIGIFFDFFDGFFARKFKVSGPLGVQLDSLADMVTSGVTPGFVMYKMLLPVVPNPAYAFAGFIITMGSCMRLAKFNIDDRQTDSFIGLPTPANALFILSLPIIAEMQLMGTTVSQIINSYVFLGIVILLSAWIMNAELPLFSLKIKSDRKAFRYPLVFIVLSIILLVLFQFAAVPLIITLYVVMSLFQNMFSK